MDRRIIVFISVYLITSCALAQENVTTFGIQIKPMINSKFFGTGASSVQEGDLVVSNNPQLGWNLGAVVRRGITKNWSFETGINIVSRNYQMRVQYPELPEDEVMTFRFVGYEIPLQGMIYVRLGDNLFMNASGGVSIDLYPSDIESFGDQRKDTLRFDFYQRTYKSSWVQVAVLANYGFEWRTKEDGYFYLGASFHRPFSNIATTAFRMERNTYPTRLQYTLSGSYLTLDFRYFFHEDPDRKRARKK